MNDLEALKEMMGCITETAKHLGLNTDVALFFEKRKEAFGRVNALIERVEKALDDDESQVFFHFSEAQALGWYVFSSFSIGEIRGAMEERLYAMEDDDSFAIPTDDEIGSALYRAYKNYGGGLAEEAIRNFIVDQAIIMAEERVDAGS